jgi:hypothetical protein
MRDWQNRQLEKKGKLCKFNHKMHFKFTDSDLNPGLIFRVNSFNDTNKRHPSLVSYITVTKFVKRRSARMHKCPSVRYGGFGDSFWNKRENGSMLGVVIGKISYCLNRVIEGSE